MGSGNPRIITNTLERAVSTDLNRTESFMAYDSHEFARHLVNREIAGDFHNFPGMRAPFTALPPSSDFLQPHDCISGLMVRPDNAAGLLIDPGEAAFFVPAFPNATADDSKYVYVSSPGIVSVSDLPFVANAGPGIRWDIVECQPTENLIESASRDIYNATTGQFTSSVVPKVRAGALTFRIRAGTAGAGIPAPDSAWMPLAAIHVRTDSTGFSNCDVYDIRPLVNERCAWSPENFRALPSPVSNFPGYRLTMDEAEFSFAPPTAGINGKALGGYFRSHYAGYYSGGQLRRNTPSQSLANFGVATADGGSFAYFNPQTTENKSSAYSIAGDDRFVVGAFFPRGYVRWVRYSQTSLTPSSANRLRKTGRLPNGTRGVLWITKSTVFANGIIPGDPPPTAFGDTEPAFGHAICEGFTNGTTEFYPAIGGGNDRKFWIPTDRVTVASGGTPSLASNINSGFVLPPGVMTVSGSAMSADFIFSRAYPVPPYARALLIDFNIGVTMAGACDIRFDGAYIVKDSGASQAMFLPMHFPSIVTMSTNLWQFKGACWVPAWTNDNFDDTDIASPGPFEISFLFVKNGAAYSADTCTARLLGYQL